jgi:anti-sigma factor RsiW
MGHLGARVSALLDGRLDPAEEERCWDHVHQCHACRDLVEREGWVKTRLAQLSWGPASPAAPDGLKASLRGQCGAVSAARFPVASRTRSRTLVAIGGGAAGACVVGVLALGLGTAPRVEPRPPATDLSRPTGPASPSVVEPGRRAGGRAGVPAAPLTERLVAVREKMGP